MRRVRWFRIAQFAIPGFVLLQITACLGPDPQLFLTTSIANSIVASAIATLFNLFVTGLTTTA